MRIERLWVAGESTVEVIETVHGSKTLEPAWSSQVVFDGPHFDEVVAEHLRASVLRFTGANWARKPRAASYERWVEHMGLR